MKYSTIYLDDCFPLAVIRYGLVVRIPGSHPGGPGSIPGNGNFAQLFWERFFYRVGPHIEPPILIVNSQKQLI